MRVAKVLRDKGTSLQRLRKCLAYPRKHASEVEQPRIARHTLMALNTRINAAVAFAAVMSSVPLIPN